MIRTILPLFALPLAASAPALATENVPVSPVQRHGASRRRRGPVRKGPVQRVTIVEGSSQFTAIRVLSHGHLRIDACNASCPHTISPENHRREPHRTRPRGRRRGQDHRDRGFRRPAAADRCRERRRHDRRAALNADAATAAVHGGGEIKLRALRVLTAAVNGGGTIRYWGDPEVTSAISGGGTVRRGR